MKLHPMAIVALVVVLAAGAFLAFAATRPDTFRVERSITINAPPEAIAPLIEDFHRWRSWSPYETLDPAMARAYEGAAQGVGAVYSWSGDRAGAGRMEIIDASRERIAIQLDFTKPMQARNLAEFLMAPGGAGATNVTWAMSGPMPLMSKAMSVFMSMDGLVGKDFESGLAKLKAQAEQS